MKTKIWLCLVCFLLSVTSLPAQAAAAVAPVTAEQTAVAFYKWYLHAIAKGEVPTDELNGPIKQYIAPNLSVTLRKMLRNGDMDSDYFLKAQDFLPDWANNVSATPAKAHGPVQYTEITLGETKKSRHRVAVNLTRSDSLWKITSVLPLKE